MAFVRYIYGKLVIGRPEHRMRLAAWLRDGLGFQIVEVDNPAAAGHPGAGQGPPQGGAQAA
jgi:hypothetical protein